MKIVCLDNITPIEMDDEIPDTCIALGHVGDHFSDLSENEKKLVKSVSASRRHEFSSGRRVARAAMQAIGIQPAEILAAERRPMWPEHVAGSIAHSRTIAVSAVSSRERHRGLGIDVIPVTAVSEKTGARVLSENELRWVRELGPGEWRTAVFSAKEAIYKAVNPLVGEFLGFNEVEVAVDEMQLSFTAHTNDPRPSSPAVASGRGFIHRVSGHWLTVFLVD